MKNSDGERLECLVSQSFFALDAPPAIGQFMEKHEKWCLTDCWKNSGFAFCCSTCRIGKIFLSSIAKVIYLLKLPSQNFQSRCHFLDMLDTINIDKYFFPYILLHGLFRTNKYVVNFDVKCSQNQELKQSNLDLSSILLKCKILKQWSLWQYSSNWVVHLHYLDLWNLFIS